ncbi:putative xyloglucan endotransglucosylase/hydrolase protein 30 [Glycine soja]
MAATTRNNDVSATNGGLVMSLINKSLSALYKKLNRILAMEETSNGDVFEKSHDELDFEFLGNVAEKPWRFQMNLYDNDNTKHGREEHYHKALKWSDRLAISIGVAKVVHLLHTGVIAGCFRNQLKTNNILLDEHHILRLSDYGMSMIAEEIEYLEQREKIQNHGMYTSGSLFSLSVTTCKWIL